MAQVLEMALGAVLGLGLIAGVFWLAFRRLPDAREPPQGSDQMSYWSASNLDLHNDHSG